jgi:hypothetical protein
MKGLKAHQALEHAEAWCSLCENYFEDLAAHKQKWHQSLKMNWKVTK